MERRQSTAFPVAPAPPEGLRRAGRAGAVIGSPALPALTSFAFIGLVLVVDQMLLPMFHVGNFPYKVSYALCALWLTNFTLARGTDEATRYDFLRICTAFAVIMGCALLGELLLAGRFAVSDHAQTVRSVLIYVLVTLAFGLGLSAHAFRVKWLLWVLIVALLLNFGFVFLKSAMPAWLINLYYSDKDVANFADFGIYDVRGLLEMARPRGLLPNPNASALMVNIIVLFIYLGMRHRLMLTPGPLLGLAIVGLPVLLSLVLASRGELVVAVLLGILNYRLILRGATVGGRARLILYTSVVPVFASIALMRVMDAGSLGNSVDRARSIFGVFAQEPVSPGETRSLDTVARPLLTFERMTERLQISPVFGTGFSATVGRPFEDSTEYFHNDWFRLLATSGLVGLAAMLWILWRYCLPLGWVALVPFVLPGMVNTFMLNIPAFIFYFFMVGVLREKLRLQAVA